MKVLIWVVTLFCLALIQTFLRMSGVILGAIPTVILFGAALYIAKALCKSVDQKRMVENPDEYLKVAADPLRKVGSEEWACPVCGTVLSNATDTCISCGMSRVAAQNWRQKQETEKKQPSIVREPRPGDWNCPKCGTVHDKDIERCWKCGPLKKDAMIRQISIFELFHISVHEMARDEARHGKALKGLLERYFR